jgi:hypothetical protein
MKKNAAVKKYVDDLCKGLQQYATSDAGRAIKVLREQGTLRQGETPACRWSATSIASSLRAVEPDETDPPSKRSLRRPRGRRERRECHCQRCRVESPHHFTSPSVASSMPLVTHDRPASRIPILEPGIGRMLAPRRASC